ncbi:restriction endonuclease subunit S [Lyngbya sp. CCAP 1446/10]|uniref:restriction endonuclease subunit S n=1 Tax=Lyngbya sp. CCAP 1446/10 TaxID=439293 RepID=UPI002236F57A|nr:restriction endonuclease subunit S [Lyngbya sp. CCAP 1446/10]MCW6050167.1 restriction endonuclease subunit S [Lyngbya sp. CCAP 1446/10]
MKLITKTLPERNRREQINDKRIGGDVGMKAGWVKLPFVDVILDESGGNIKTPQREFLISGHFAVVDQGKNLVSGYVDNKSCLCKASLPVIVFGDHTRCFKFVDFPFCMGADGVKVLRPKVEADVKYLFYYLRQLNLPDGGYDRHFKYLKRSHVLLPPLEEQKRIAEILDRAEGLRAKRREAIAQLDTLTQSIFLEMFGDPVRNPKGWKILNFGEIALEKGLIVDGPFGSTLKPESYVEAGVRVIRNFNINDAFFDGSKFVYITIKKFAEIYRSHVCTGDILLSTKGTIGDVCVMPNLLGDSVLSASGTVRIRLPINSPLIADFIVYQMIQSSYKQYMKSFEAGTNQKYLNLSRIRQMELIVPSLNLQQEFARRVEAVEKLKTAHRASLSELDALFASLQHRAFRGEL